ADAPVIPGSHPDGYIMVGDTPVDISVVNPTIAELAQLETPDPFTHAYGLGLQIIQLPCGVTSYGHEGGIYGYGDFVLSTLDGSKRVEVVGTTANGPTGTGAETMLEDAFCR